MTSSFVIKNLALQASAGSGKTYALSVRYISLLFMGSMPEQILTLTFTNKAALEMKERIFSTLKNLESTTELNDICELTGKSKNEILSTKPLVLKTFLKSDLKISTIDSFFSLMLRKFSFNIGLMPDFKLEDSIVNDDLIERFLKICKQELLYKSLVLFAINEKKKLSDIFSLFATLFEQHSEINLSQYANKNFPYQNEKEILDLVDEIREKFIKNGLGENALKTLRVSSVKELLGKKFLAKDDFSYWSYKKYTDDERNALHVELKKKLFAFAQKKEAYVLQQLAKLYEAFVRALKIESKINSSLSFSQMTNELFDMLKDEIAKDFLYFRLDGNFKHLLVDEFQDTNIVQYKILEPFMREIVSGIGTKEDRTLFLVGDAKQSIYRFRGGVKELFSYAVSSLHLDVGVLGVNYRSSKKVVNFINSTFKGKILDYIDQKYKEDAPCGFVKVIIDDEIVENLMINLKNLLSLGVKQNDIAVLCYTNQEALILKELIEDEIKEAKVTMEARRKLIDIPIISAIIDFIFYLYFKDDLYLENFQFLSGRKYNPGEYEFSFDDGIDNLVSKIIREFDIFDYEDDLLMFIQSCSVFRDIEDFLFNYQDISQSSISKKDEGIRVLTIHKSKGLEFPNLFLLDRIKRPRSGGGTFVFEYDDIQLTNIFLKIKSREFFDDAYKNAKDKESIKEEEDIVNTQYVAITRAKDNLFVLAKEKSSAFSNLDLCEFEEGVIHVREAKEEKPKKMINLLKQKSYGVQKTEKIEVNKTKTSDFRAIDFGLALHYMLEILGEFKESFIENAYESMKNRYKMILDEDDLKDIKKRVVRLVNNREFCKIIKNGKLLREQPLYYNSQRKQLDLLIEFDERVIVVDYKSSELLQSSHVKQVAVYRDALQEIYSKKCEAYLCYLKQEKNEIIKV